MSKTGLLSASLSRVVAIAGACSAFGILGAAPAFARPTYMVPFAGSGTAATPVLRLPTSSPRSGPCSVRAGTLKASAYRCGRATHLRVISMSGVYLSGSAARAIGYVKALDGFSRCANSLPVSVQRLSGGRWVTIARGRTRSHVDRERRASWAVNGLPTRDGTYRAVAPRISFGNQVCAFASNAIRSIDASKPIGLSGGGVADSLGGFLQQIFMTSITWTVGQKFSIRLAVDYSYALRDPDGADGPTGLVPVLLLPPRGFDPTSDPRVQPTSLMCSVESMIATWQSAEAPAVGGAYIFNLTVYGSGQRLQSTIYTGTLRYTVPSGGLGSPGCD
jgi:hypothetical protein